MESSSDHVSYARVGQLRTQLPHALFSNVTKGANLRAGKRVQGFISFNQSVMNRTRELPVQQQEIYNLLRGKMMVTFAVHFQRAGGTQHRRPLDVVNRSAHIGHCRQQKKVFHIKNARGLVRTFDQLSETTEVPPFPMRQSGVGKPFEE